MLYDIWTMRCVKKEICLQLQARVTVYSIQLKIIYFRVACTCMRFFLELLCCKIKIEKQQFEQKMFRFKLIHQKILFLLFVFVIVLWLIKDNIYLTKSSQLQRTILSDTNNCAFDKIKYITDSLCDLYKKQKLIIGKQCDHLCNSQRFDLVRCYSSSNKIALVYKTTGTNEVVFKSKFKHFYDYNIFEYDLDLLTTKADLNGFLHAQVNSTLFRSYKKILNDNQEFLDYIGVFIDHQTFERYYASKTSSIADNRVFTSNVLSLLQQEEYVFHKTFENRQNVLHIDGTCGHFYAIEKADSLYSRIKTYDRSKRLHVANMFLELVENFESNLMLGRFKTSLPLQICDVKLENFGLNSKNELMIIDTDMVYLDSNLFDRRFCKTHDDCRFFDCHSYCSANTSLCAPYRRNNNLQIVCEKIFNNPYFPTDALLSGLFLKDIMFNKALKQCSTPDTGADMMVAAADMNLIKVFRTIFSKHLVE
jgi:hypothetical protein